MKDKKTWYEASHIEFYNEDSIEDWRMALDVRAANEVYNQKYKYPVTITRTDVIHAAYIEICNEVLKKPGQEKEYYKKCAIGAIKDFITSNVEYNKDEKYYPFRLRFDTNNLSIEGIIWRKRDEATYGRQKRPHLTEDKKEEKAIFNSFYAGGAPTR